MSQLQLRQEAKDNKRLVPRGSLRDLKGRYFQGVEGLTPKMCVQFSRGGSTANGSFLGHLSCFTRLNQVCLQQIGSDGACRSGLTPLHWAAERGSAEAVAALLAAGADKAWRGRRGDLGARRGGTGATARGARWGWALGGRRTWRGNAPLHCAAKQEHLHVVKLLLDAGAAKALGGRDQPELPLS